MHIYLSGLWGSTLNLSTVLRFIFLITNVVHHQLIPSRVCIFADDWLPWEVIGRSAHDNLWLIWVVLIYQVLPTCVYFPKCAQILLLCNDNQSGRCDNIWKCRDVGRATWLILPVVICLSQRLSHACLSINCLYCETANGSLNQL